MALSKDILSLIKGEYQRGKVSKTKIAQKFGISRNTLQKHAEKNKWQYGISEQEIDRIVQKETFEKNIEQTVNKSVQINEQFIADLERFRQLALEPANQLARAYNEAREKGAKVAKKEFTRINEAAKAVKTSIEALKLGYEGARKALGIDNSEDVEKALAIKRGPDNTNFNEFENYTVEELIEIQQQILDDTAAYKEDLSREDPDLIIN